MAKILILNHSHSNKYNCCSFNCSHNKTWIL